MTVHKTYPISHFKALPSEGEGTFEAIVSVFGNVDLQGDRVMPGAFEKSIQKWQKKGDPIPVIWSHAWGDPFAHIGFVDPNDVREIVPSKASNKTSVGGLYVKGHLDVHKPFAKQVYDLLAERRVREHSFSYDIPPGGERRAKDGANELVEVDIIEVGPTLKGANPNTVLLGTKSDSEDERRMKLRLDRAADADLLMKLAQAEGTVKAGDAGSLIRWFNEGAEGAIPWGSPGDFDACVTIASSHMTVEEAHGFCQRRHMEATGMTTSEHAHGSGKAGEESGVKFDPNQDRDGTGQWTDGGNNPKPKPKPKPKPGHGDDGKPLSDDKHPLGEGTLKNLRSALRDAGMPKHEVQKLAQDMRDHFHETGKINIPPEADKYLSTQERNRLASEIRAEAEHRGWKPEKAETADGQKAGRVIGSKAAAELKSMLNDAVDEFIAKMNGSSEDDVPPKEKATRERLGLPKAVDEQVKMLHQSLGEALETLDPTPVTADKSVDHEKLEFAKGYSDGSTGRPADARSATDAYVRGYTEGTDDRLTVSKQEISAFEQQLSALEYK